MSVTDNINFEVNKVMGETTMVEKLALFYELAKYVYKNTEGKEDMKKLRNDVGTVIIDLKTVADL